MSPTPHDNTVSGAEGSAIREGGWIEWSGGECPIADGLTPTKVRLRDGDTSLPVIGAKYYDWRHDTGLYPREWDIIAYRVVQS